MSRSGRIFEKALSEKSAPARPKRKRSDRKFKPERQSTERLAATVAGTTYRASRSGQICEQLSQGLSAIRPSLSARSHRIAVRAIDQRFFMLTLFAKIGFICKKTCLRVQQLSGSRSKPERQATNRLAPPSAEDTFQDACARCQHNAVEQVKDSVLPTLEKLPRYSRTSTQW